MPDSITEVLMELSRRLLAAIDRQDWPHYAALCDPSLTAFEPEASGHLIEGMGFHRFYFDMESNGRTVQSNIASPHVRVCNDTAVVSYVRLVQSVQADGDPVTASFDETRVWQRQNGEWKHVHFHRSPA